MMMVGAAPGPLAWLVRGAATVAGRTPRQNGRVALQEWQNTRRPPLRRIANPGVAYPEHVVHFEFAVGEIIDLLGCVVALTATELPGFHRAAQRQQSTVVR